MRVFYDLADLPIFKNPVLTIGTFDGVHIGHKAILERVRNHAQEISGETVIITFDPHPRIALNPNSSLSLIYTLDERIRAMADLGIDNLVVVNFTREFANQSAEQYIKDFLVNHFHPSVVIIGYDHQFGKDRSGDFRLFEKYKEEYKYQLVEIPVQELEHSVVSSTRIRKAIQSGDVAAASLLLGRNYSFEGHVVHGDKRGRTIGYPTANLVVSDVHKIIPAHGVYAVNVSLQGKSYKGMMNIGIRPTVEDGASRKIEVHLFEFDAQIYNESLHVECIVKIRDEQKFSSLDQLKERLSKDKIEALEILNSNKGT